MKKIELLAPAGNMESLVAAISAGADAIYISGKKYGARAFAANFSDEEIKEAIKYAHLYDVKIYVTVNTIIYESEMDDFINYVSFLHENGVDAIIIQDLGAMDLVRNLFPNLEIHASTQMNIHSLESVKLLEKLHIRRAVLAREMSIDEIKYIKDNSNIELEVFVQGALCISYSGQCLMSSLIGGRSGNRGTCAQCCRQRYDLIKDNKVKIKDKYILSTKDLMTLNSIDKLIDIGVDSLKIEGRMKRKEYVYLAVSLYRKAIDSYLKTGKIDINDNDIKELKKIFNRKFTKGFLFNELNSNFTNMDKPNHQGIEIGKVVKIKDNSFYIKLTDDLNINDGIRILDEDIGFTVTNMFINEKQIRNAKAGDIVKLKGKVNSYSKIFKTTDYEQINLIDNLIKNSKRLPINMSLIAHINNPLKLVIKYKDYEVEVKSDYIVNEALKMANNKDDLIKRLSKLNDTVYISTNISIDMDNNIFIPVGILNDLRRCAVNKLNELRLVPKRVIKGDYKINVPNFKIENKKSVLIDSEKIIDGYDLVYDFEDIDGTVLKLDRIMKIHPDIKKSVLVSELGSINKYKNVMTDFSLNVVNSYTVAFLHSLGVSKITLSYELEPYQIKEIIDAYHNRYNKHPNLEVIVSGYEEAMVCKYVLDGDYIRDRFKNLFKIKIRNDYMYIYNYKKRALNYDFYSIGVNWIRENKELK